MVAIDRPGVGGTAPPARSAVSPAEAAAQAADDMVATLDGLGWARATVVVHSAGAYAGVTMAARHPDQVSRLILIAAAGPDMGDAEAAAMDSGARSFFDLCRDEPRKATMVLSMMRIGLAIAPGPATRSAAVSLPRPDRALLDDHRARDAFVAMVRRGLRPGPRGVVADGRAARGPWPIDVGCVRCSVDLYAGGQDRNVPPEVAQGWALRIPTARLRRLPEAGHVSILPLVAERVLASIEGGESAGRGDSSEPSRGSGEAT